MSGVGRTLDAITLFVEDPQRSKAFYGKVFDVDPLFEEDATSVAFRLDNFVLNLLVRSSAPELIEPAAVGDAGSGSRFQLTIGVEDAHACAALTGHGIELLNGPMDRPWGVRTAAFADPDGHVWERAAAIPER
jgi:catechol 2,3-dioxygenase-like lactoylglutathione lyase family enzyme